MHQHLFPLGVFQGAEAEISLPAADHGPAGRGLQDVRAASVDKRRYALIVEQGNAENIQKISAALTATSTPLIPFSPCTGTCSRPSRRGRGNFRRTFESAAGPRGPFEKGSPARFTFRCRVPADIHEIHTAVGSCNSPARKSVIVIDFLQDGKDFFSGTWPRRTATPCRV